MAECPDVEGALAKRKLKMEAEGAHRGRASLGAAGFDQGTAIEELDRVSTWTQSLL